MKTCRKCDERKEDDKFHIGNSYGPICDECFDADEKAAYHEACRAEAVASHKAAR